MNPHLLYQCPPLYNNSCPAKTESLPSNSNAFSTETTNHDVQTERDKIMIPTPYQIIIRFQQIVITKINTKFPLYQICQKHPN